MDAVRAFNNELSSLYETKPPVSRAKMGAVTRAAIKAIKFYKHVVQSVEKFVLKCKPEYKIPGLYVIDSVVRQSRHQFGGDKDMFGPRFTKNIVPTFQSLLKCSAEDRSRVVRVLNLWQKNTVFPMEMIQALLDMASDPTNPDCVVTAQRVADNVVLEHQRSLGKLPSGGGGPGPGEGPAPSAGAMPPSAPAPGPVPANGGTDPSSGPEESLMAQQSDIVNTVTRLLQQTGEGSAMTSGQDVQLQQLQLLQQQLVMHTELMSHKPQQTTSVIDNNLLAQIKRLTDQLLCKAEPPPSSSSAAAAPGGTGLPPPPPPPPLPALPHGVPDIGHTAGRGFVPIGEARDVSSGIGGLLPRIMGRERLDDPSNNAALPPMGGPPPRDLPKTAEPLFNKKLLDFDYGDSEDEEMDQNQNEMDVQQHQHHPHHQHHHQHQHLQQQQQQQQQQLPGDVHKLLSDPALMQHIHNVSTLKSDQLRPDGPDPEALLRKQHLEQQQEQFNKEIEQTQYSGFNQDQDVIVVEEQDDRDYDRDRRRSRHSRDRSRDRSRSPKRRRHSRSRSRERRRSRDRHRRSRSRDYDRERQQREKDRERKKKGLPPVKDKYISLCSTTLWFGHLAKYTTEDALRSEIENYGSVESIKMVPPRGCAFVNMMWRKEAAKALDRMKGLKLNSSALRVAWAPNMGMKESAFKDRWDVELGVTYIPWDKLPSDLSPLLDGAMIDEDTLPEHLKGSIIERQQDQDGRGSENYGGASNNQSGGFGAQPIPSSQHMALVPPRPMMIPPPGSLPPPGISIPPPGHMPLPGQIPLPGQNNPQGLPPNLLPPPGGPVSLPIGLSRPPSVQTPGVYCVEEVCVCAPNLLPPPGGPVSLPIGLSRPPVCIVWRKCVCVHLTCCPTWGACVPVHQSVQTPGVYCVEEVCVCAPNLLPPPGGPVSLPIGLSRPPVASAAAALMGMDGALSRPPLLPLNSSASIILPGQQPGMPARPGLPPGPPPLSACRPTCDPGWGPQGLTCGRSPVRRTRSGTTAWMTT
ncbi:hypothetical protein ACOMHN_054053 [Nucella lapillus]